MTEVPVSTFWDVLAGALDDGMFWLISAIVLLGGALVVRVQIDQGRRRWRCSTGIIP